MTAPPDIETHPDWRERGVEFVGGACVQCGATDADEWHARADDGLGTDPRAGYACPGCADVLGPPLAERRADPARLAQQAQQTLAERRIERG